MDLQGLLNNPRAGSVALKTSRVLPPRVGYRLADILAGRIADSPGTPMVQGIRLNQWIVSDQKLSGEALDRAVVETLRYIARSFYTLFHYLENLENLYQRIELSPQLETVLQIMQEGRQGLVVVGVHMSSFDVLLQAIAKRGMRFMALSLPQPDEAVDWQHEFRRHSGVEILPATIHNFRHVIERLKAGETLVTGMDRPQPGTKYKPQFFGHPASVPVHYVQLALRAQVPLVVMAAVEQDNGKYHIMASDFIDLDSLPDRREEIIHNAEKALRYAEQFIRLAPHQWAMFHPVWPDLLQKVTSEI